MQTGLRFLPTKQIGGLGALALAAGLLLERFGSGVGGQDFLVGALIGLSLTLNLFFLLRFRAERARS